LARSQRRAVDPELNPDVTRREDRRIERGDAADVVLNVPVNDVEQHDLVEEQGRAPARPVEEREADPVAPVQRIARYVAKLAVEGN